MLFFAAISYFVPEPDFEENFLSPKNKKKNATSNNQTPKKGAQNNGKNNGNNKSKNPNGKPEEDQNTKNEVN